MLKYHVVITPESGESWYWLSPDAEVDEEGKVLTNPTTARYDLLWSPDYELTLEYRDDLPNLATGRWRSEWMEYIFGIEPFFPDPDDPLIPGVSPVKEIVVQYRPSIYDRDFYRARLAVYRPEAPVVVLARRFLPGTFPPGGYQDWLFTQAVRSSTLYGLDILSTIVGHVVEHIGPGVDKTRVTWLIRYGVYPPTRRMHFDHPFLVWHAMPCQWHCPGGKWWVADYDLVEIDKEEAYRIVREGK